MVLQLKLNLYGSQLVKVRVHSACHDNVHIEQLKIFFYENIFSKGETNPGSKIVNFSMSP